MFPSPVARRDYRYVFAAESFDFAAEYDRALVEDVAPRIQHREFQALSFRDKVLVVEHLGEVTEFATPPRNA